MEVISEQSQFGVFDKECPDAEVFCGAFAAREIEVSRLVGKKFEVLTLFLSLGL